MLYPPEEGKSLTRSEASRGREGAKKGPHRGKSPDLSKKQPS